MGDVTAVAVNRQVCIGSGMCMVYAPHTFEHDSEAKIFVSDPSGDPPEQVREAVYACPAGALSLGLER